jgi:hypothetical protein
VRSGEAASQIRVDDGECQAEALEDGTKYLECDRREWGSLSGWWALASAVRGDSPRREETGAKMWR